MEARKTKHPILKLVLHYIFLAIMFALTIVAYIFRADISNFFAGNVTNIEVIDLVLHYVPAIIWSIQIIVVAAVINLVLKGLSKLGFGLTDKAKTVLNIIYSLLKWVVIIGAVLMILSAWGVDTTTLLAGAGIVALVIGLAAQSMIADILAGIVIVLEGEYVVGDIVVIDGWRGKIINIGIRTTELQDIGGNIKIINNSEIKTVINQTKLQSIALVSIDVSSEESLTKVEKLIKEALPEIKNAIPSITADIEYKGITKITDISTEMLFGAPCYEEDLYQVQRDLHRKLKLLLDKNGVESFAPPSYVISGKKETVAKPSAKSLSKSTQQPNKPQNE